MNYLSFKNDIKFLRIKYNFTQEEIAQKLNVTRQTVSTWETGKNMPNLETLHELSHLFNISLEKLLFEEDDNVKKLKKLSIASKIDSDVKLKNRYLFLTLALSFIICITIAITTVFLVGYNKGIENIDRINPFISYKVGYTKLPKNEKKLHGYWTSWFDDNSMGTEWTKLHLTTGINPGIKDPYVMAYYKGSYVKIARIVPSSYVNKIYISNLQALNSLLNNKGNTSTNNNDLNKFKNKTHVSDTIQQLVTK